MSINLEILNRTFLSDAITESGMRHMDICIAAGIARETLHRHLECIGCMSSDNLLKVLMVLTDHTPMIQKRCEHCNCPVWMGHYPGCSGEAPLT